MYNPDHDCVKLNADRQTCPCMMCIVKAMCMSVHSNTSTCEVYIDWYKEVIE